MGKFYLMLAKCCLGWSHLFMVLGKHFTDEAYRAETRR